MASMMSLLESCRQRVRELKSETFALYLAARCPETPWYAKLFVAGIVGYALSPIDLIPDFIPILGYVDDLVLIPIGIAFAIKLIPPPVMASCRVRARESVAKGAPVSRIAGCIIVLTWLALAAVGVRMAFSASAE